jgi:membrane-associated phospholipid phosphatase
MLRAALVLFTITATAGLARSPAAAQASDRARAHRWRKAAARAATDPHAWGPAAAAGVVAVLDADRRISSWAVERTPVFGSPEDAEEASDDLQRLAHVGMIATAFAAPRDREGRGGSRWVRLVADEGAAVAVRTATAGLKDATGRERPNGMDDRSMPSGHASTTFAYAGLARRNVERMRLPRAGHLASVAAFDTVAGLTAWGRVEAGAHYPTDVLVGASLGSFLSRWLEEGMLGRHGVEVSLALDRDGIAMTATWRPTGSRRWRGGDGDPPRR